MVAEGRYVQLDPGESKKMAPMTMWALRSQPAIGRR